ncbi:MAG: Major Facilitator Superfamily protein [Candidatus Lokiarchaeum sp. GC14_75]|nr:MAG: Major Facilitator Superfamily protein [Candidatus Lokiarchaeum sp. GC14_75]
MRILKKNLAIQEESDFESKLSEPYRTWPVFLLAFIRLFYVSIFERALSNYLIWDIGIRKSTLGFITSAGAISYIVAPILGQYITKKYLGIRNALIFTSISTPILTGAQIFFPTPGFLIICRITIGISMGFFWPNCLTLMSKWQKISSFEKSKKNFAIFNLSWNSGFIVGLIVGFLLVIFSSDLLAMIISWGFSFLLIPASLFIKKDSKAETTKDGIIYQTEDPLTHLDIEESLVVNSKTPLVVYPILFSWVGVMFLAISKSSIMFSYPLFLNAITDITYFTYLVQLGIQSTQLIGLTLTNSMKTHSKKVATLVGLTFIIIFASAIAITKNIIVISILSACAGLFIGFIHGTSMKIMLEYGTAKDSTRYSTINEIIIGISFGFTPLIAGFVAEINIYSIFLFLAISGSLVLIFMVYISRNIKKNV